MKNAQFVLELLFAHQNDNDPVKRKIQKLDISTVYTDNITAIDHNRRNENETLRLSTSTSDNIDNILEEEISVFITKVLDDTKLKLAFSEHITDVLYIFKHLTELHGKIDFVIAIMFSVIYEDKLWIQYGYNSLDSFLNNLPSTHRITRQTFINTALAGKMIRYFGFCDELKKFGSEFKLTPKLFYRNYSKIKLLYRIYKVWKLEITNEIMLNFRDMNYRTFNNFVNKYKNQNINNIKKRYYHKSFLAKHSTELKRFLNCRPFKINNLTGWEYEIYKRIRLGYIVECVNSTNPKLVDSVIKYLEDKYKKDYDLIHKDTFSSSEIFYDCQPDTTICDVDWAEFVPDNLHLTIEHITYINFDLNPGELRNSIINKTKNKIELTLAQAALIYFIEHNKKLHSSIANYFIIHKIERQFTLEVDFAIFVLDIKLSRYKWLKRIGNSMPYLKQLKSVIDFTGDLLDKLSYLKTAFDYHEGNQALITDAFVMLSAKRFRKFAYDKNDDLSDELINRSDYQKAKLIINKKNISMITYSPVTIIFLQSEKQRKWLEEINEILNTKNIILMKNIPDIDWDSEFSTEIKKQKIIDRINEKNKHIGLQRLFVSEKEILDELGSLNV